MPAVLLSVTKLFVSVALLAEIPPPGDKDPSVLLPLTVLFVSVNEYPLKMPPPLEASYPVVLLPLTVLSVRVAYTAQIPHP